MAVNASSNSLVRQSGWRVRLRNDDEIQPEILGLRCPLPQRNDDHGDARRILADPAKCVGQEYGDCVVRRRNCEDPSRRRGIERHVDDDGSMDLLEDGTDRLDQRFAERGQGHAAAAGDEQLVVERVAQTRQHTAHRRLTEMDAAARVGDAPLREQRVEGDEQIEIETV